MLSVLAVIILLVLGVVYYVYDPSISIFFPKCPFQMLTDLPCAGCGSQRAIHSLLHFQFADAIRYNALIVAFVPLVFVLILAFFLRKRLPKFYYYTHHRYVAYAVLIIVMLWWILRIIFGWYV